MITQHVITPKEHQNWFERSIQNPRLHLLIYQDNHTAIGFAQLSVLSCGGIAEWGFYVAPDAPKGSGRGLGKHTLLYAFTELSLHKVYAQTLASNERSIQFHQALGFQPEGTLRNQYFDGEHYHDLLCFGLLAQEWQQKLLIEKKNDV